MSENDPDDDFTLSFDQARPTQSLDTTDTDIEPKPSMDESKDEESLHSGKQNVQRNVWVKASLWRQFSIAKKDMRVTWNELIVVMLSILRSQKRISDGAWKEIESIMELDEQSSLGWMEWHDLGIDSQTSNLLVGLLAKEQEKTRRAIEELNMSVEDHGDTMLHNAELEVPNE